jgi:hypothetical protein
VVAPMLFFCAFLMAHEKTMLIGYLSALLFASTGQFQNHMTYDPVGLINTSIAAVSRGAWFGQTAGEAHILRVSDR